MTFTKDMVSYVLIHQPYMLGHVGNGIVFADKLLGLWQKTLADVLRRGRVMKGRDFDERLLYQTER